MITILEQNRSDKRRVLSPVAHHHNLAHEVSDRIAAEIMSGNLAPGTRLPTEQEMVAAMGVSRTVVREAVAALRAEGLVITRQGVGAFVAADVGRRPFRLAVEGLPSVEEVLNVMELRQSVETEAAGLAATRSSPAARQRMATALAAIDAAIAQGDTAIDQDFAFHRAIAAATGNPQFAHFLEYLGRFIIPRQSIRVAAHHAEGRRAYLEMFQQEHRTISAAIEAGDAAAAREAMRQHLSNSQQRYRRLAEEAKAGGADRTERHK